MAELGVSSGDDGLRRRLRQAEAEASHWSQQWTRLRRQYDDISEKHNRLQRIVTDQRPVLDELVAQTTALVTEFVDDEAMERLDAGIKRLFTMNYRDHDLEALPDANEIDSDRLRLYHAYVSLYQDYQRLAADTKPRGFSRDLVLRFLLRLVNQGQLVAEVAKFLENAGSKGELTPAEVEELKLVLENGTSTRARLSALDWLPEAIASASTANNSYIDSKDSQSTVYAADDDHNFLKAQVDTLTAQLGQLNHHHAHCDNHHQQWKTTTDTLTKENDELRQQIHQLQLQQSSDDAVKRENARLWQEQRELVAQIRELSAPRASEVSELVAAHAELARLERRQRRLVVTTIRRQRTFARAVAGRSMEMLRQGVSYDPQRQRLPLTFRTAALLVVAAVRLRRHGDHRRRDQTEIAAVDGALDQQRQRVAELERVARR